MNLFAHEDAQMPGPKLRPYQLGACYGDDNYPGVLPSFKEVDSTLASLATGTGKCLGRDTPVLMFNGTIKPVQEIEIGELLMGPDSKPRRVLSLARGIDNLYRVTPVKGDPYVVNEAHILSLKCTSDHSRKYQKGAVTNISVLDYLSENRTFKHMMKGWRTGVDFPENDVAMDPYFLGVWLAEGSSNGTQITNPDTEIIEYIYEYAEYLGLSVTASFPDKRCESYSITSGRNNRSNPILYILRDYGLIGNKHVPHEYKANSRDVRLALLAGYIDGDGYLTSGCYDVVSKQELLANDIAFVARSLGLAAYVTPCEKTCYNTGAVGQYYRTSISGDIDMIPCRVPRRQAQPRKQIKNVLLTGISVESIGRGEYFGFEIDGDRLFMLGDFTVTHNTIIMAKLAQEEINANGTVLWLTHREELMNQGRKALAMHGIHSIREKAEDRAVGNFGLTSNTVVASTASMRGDRLAQWPKDAFSLIISDEAHHSLSPTWRGILKHFDGHKHVGFTATADRLDGQNAGQIFQSVAYEYDLRQAVKDGYLVPIEAFPIEVNPPIDLRDLRTTAGDFNSGDLEQVFLSCIETVANAVIDSNALGDRPTIAFTPDIASAEGFAAAMNQLGVKSCAISYKSKNRAEIMERFRHGEFQLLVNSMLLTEGVDCPFVSCVLILRPTKSRSLFSQMVGRGTRLFEGKESLRVADLAYLLGEHKLVKAVDLYDNSSTPDEVVREADKLITEGKERDIGAALERAQQEFDLREELRVQRRIVQVRTMSYDPLGVREVLGIQDKNPYAGLVAPRPASNKMVQALRNFKIDVPDDIGFDEAKKLLDTCITRAHYHLATVRQVGTMIKMGLEPGRARRMSFQEASAWIDSNRTWGR